MTGLNWEAGPFHTSLLNLGDGLIINVSHSFAKGEGYILVFNGLEVKKRFKEDEEAKTEGLRLLKNALKRWTLIIKTHEMADDNKLTATEYQATERALKDKSLTIGMDYGISTKKILKKLKENFVNFDKI